MHKAGIILIFLLLAGMLYAQGNDPFDETDWDKYKYELFAPGDQTFMVSLGLAFPTVFFNQGKTINSQISPPVGGTGSLVFNYFMTSNVFIGGEVAGMFLPTIGGSILYVIPLGFRVGTQFIAGRFEFPVAAVLGVTWQTYLDYGYFGFYAKGSASGFYRVTSNWAFGMTAGWYFFPQWTGNSSQDIFGNILDVNLTARYQF